MGDLVLEALGHVFPSELLEYFTIVESGIQVDKPTGEEYVEVVFEEKNELPSGYSRQDYESKGFFSKCKNRGKVTHLDRGK